MKYEVYAFFDRVSATYGEPFLAPNASVAQRRFQYVMKNAPMVSADSQLYLIGEYDVSTGTVVGLEKPQFVANYISEVENEVK
ncbi:nonstructural protein [Microvirus mar8]|uniref:Nonstructural protein n=1 Tax=Microvirus mar8 TaxID=2851204 RepID=A0A8F6AHS5_9VIRU|nr:nonstructural protein [Microvirus mar8]